MKEIWSDIEGYEGLYKVSNRGNVWSSYSKRNLNPHTNDEGYKVVYLCKDRRRKALLVHRLVALAFLEKTDCEKPEVNHIDGNKTNNNINNLEWVSRSGNMLHMYRVLGKGRNGRPVLCKETGMIYRSAAEAGRKTGICVSRIRLALAGRRKSAGGFVWERM